MDGTEPEVTRYAAQVALPGIGSAGQAQLHESTVLIVGLGGLGCPVSHYLAAAGVGRLHLVDFDRVVSRNLNRQLLYGPQDIDEAKADVAALRLYQQNPDGEYIAHRHRVVADDSYFADLVTASDIVVDCCDNYISRIVVHRASRGLGKPVVSGAAIRQEGQVCLFHPQGACYECIYAGNEDIFEDCSGGGILGPVTGAVGSMMATMTIQQLLGAPQDQRLHVFDFKAFRFRSLGIKKNASCAYCSGH